MGCAMIRRDFELNWIRGVVNDNGKRFEFPKVICKWTYTVKTGMSFGDQCRFGSPTPFR
jgi:hypothetical protein